MIVYEGLNNLTWFIAVVEGNNDPTNHGRVKIRAFGFHPTVEEDTVEVDDLPWALVLRPSSHVHTPIDVGDTVIGVFMDGRDAQQPLVLGVLPLSKFSTPTIHSRSESGAGAGTGPVNPGDPGSGAGSSENAQTAYQYFINQGWSPQQAAAIVGNLQAESGVNLNPGAIGDGGQAYGIAQWHPDRQESFARVIGVPIRNSTFQQQLEFINWELNNSEKSAGDRLRDSTTVESGAVIVDQYYERSSGDHRQRRIDNAAALLQAFGAGTNSSVPQAARVEADVAVNPYMTAQQGNIENYGDGPLPPQASGERLETTPAVAATATRRSVVGGDNVTRIDQPSFPVGGSYRTGVWNTRQNGSYIELHGGSDVSQEHITITHSSGSNIVLDMNGNVTIHGVGRLIQSSMGDYEEMVDGISKNISADGYTIYVTGGGVSITSAGDMNFKSGSNINLEAGGDILLNAGGSIDVIGARAAISARVDNIDILAAQQLNVKSIGDMSFVTDANLAHQAKAKITTRSGNEQLNYSGSRIVVSAKGNIEVKAEAAASIKSGLATTIHAAGTLGLGSDSTTVLRGSTLQLNSPGYNVTAPGDADDIDDAQEATAAKAPNPPTLAFATTAVETPTPGTIGPGDVDDLV